jgi:hypothetical protein
MIKPDKEVTIGETEVHNFKIPPVEKALERFNNK